MLRFKVLCINESEYSTNKNMYLPLSKYVCMYIYNDNDQLINNNNQRVIFYITLYSIFYIQNIYSE